MQTVRLLSDSINWSVFMTHLGHLNHYHRAPRHPIDEMQALHPRLQCKKQAACPVLKFKYLQWASQYVSTHCLSPSVTVLLYPTRKYSRSYIHSHKWTVVSRVEPSKLQCHTHSVWVVQMDQFFSLSSALLVWTVTYLTYVSHSPEVGKWSAIWLKWDF